MAPAIASVMPALVLADALAGLPDRGDGKQREAG